MQKSSRLPHVVGLNVARLWTVKIKEGQEEEFYKALEQISLPFLKSRVGRGFKHLYLLRNQAKENEITYMTIWESKKRLEQNLASAEWKEALKKFEARGFQMGKPRIIHCDIIATYP